VTDSRTSAPLDPCADFRWASDLTNFWSTSGVVNSEFNVLLPNNAVLWKVYLDGYKPWCYPGTTDESKGIALQLEPGEVRRIAIRLQPDATVKDTGCGSPVGTIIRP